MSLDLKPWRALQNQFRKRIILCFTLLSVLLWIAGAWGIRHYLLKINQETHRANIFLSATIKKYDVTEALQQLKKHSVQLEAQIQFALSEIHRQQVFWDTIKLLTEKMSSSIQLSSLEISGQQFILVGTALNIAAVNHYIAELLKQKSLQSVKLIDLREFFEKNIAVVQFKIKLASKQDVVIKR